jgi:hypothetical protein
VPTWAAASPGLNRETLRQRRGASVPTCSVRWTLILGICSPLNDKSSRYAFHCVPGSRSETRHCSFQFKRMLIGNFGTILSGSPRNPSGICQPTTRDPR